MMTCADFGQPISTCPPIAGGYDADRLGRRRPSGPTIDTPAGAGGGRFLMALLEYSPPDILSMSWYERVRPYAAGKVAMAYGYTLLAPYFELRRPSPPTATPATCPTRRPRGRPIAPVGGYVWAFRPIWPERWRDAAPRR
jgi:multiple sugar transport system substrate-binding protein